LTTSQSEFSTPQRRGPAQLTPHVFWTEEPDNANVAAPPGAILRGEHAGLDGAATSGGWLPNFFIFAKASPHGKIESIIVTNW
jgi:hypothetical protein